MTRYKLHFLLQPMNEVITIFLHPINKHTKICIIDVIFMISSFFYPLNNALSTTLCQVELSLLSSNSGFLTDGLTPKFTVTFIYYIMYNSDNGTLI